MQPKNKPITKKNSDANSDRKQPNFNIISRIWQPYSKGLYRFVMTFLG